MVCGYMFYGTRISNKQFIFIFRLSLPPFLKMAVVNTNVTISQKVNDILSSNIDDIG